MRIELLNTGSELLLGEVQDLHLSWIARELFPLGLRIARQTTVPDGSAIRDLLLEAFDRSDLLIITGGLGPTTDDMTREITAELTGRKLLIHPETLERIQDRCHRRGFDFQERMTRQAMVPEGAIVMPNDNGTAPGLHLPAIPGTSWSVPDIFLLPGPPRELRPMFQSHVLPFLKSAVEVRPESSDRVECRIYRIVGMGESLLEAKVGLSLSQRGDLEVGYCARPNEVDFRLIGPREILDEVEPLVVAAAGENILPRSDESLEASLVHLLKERRETLATAESCTGGLLANTITDVPGASEVFLQGVVTYSNDSKTALLGIAPALIAEHGAVSEEVVRAMAEGILEQSEATHALATSGIAGPGGESEAKPVGTLWCALATRGSETVSCTKHLPLDRLSFKKAAVQLALDMLRRQVLSSPAYETQLDGTHS